MRNSNWTEEDIYLIAELGHSLHLQGHYREAAIIFQGLVAVDPENHYCLEALAAAWLALEEPGRAVGHIDTLLARRPDDLSARARRLETVLLLGKLDAAVKDFEFLQHLLPAAETRRLQLALEAAHRPRKNGRREQQSKLTSDN